MDRPTFAAHLHSAATAARDFARQFLEEALPNAFLFRVCLNSSYDANASAEFSLYPNDQSPTDELDERSVVELLHRDGRVPQWIDIQVVAETGDATIFELLVCGRFTSDDDKLYYAETSWAPFGVKGPTYPYPHVEGQRWSLYHRAACSSEAQLGRVQQNRDKVAFLELRGPAFDDATIARVGSMPRMHVCELNGVPMHGTGLSVLSRWPQLDHLRMRVTTSEFTFESAPVRCVLESVSITGSLATIHALGRVATRELRIATVETPTFRGSPNHALRRLTLRMPEVPAWLRELTTLEELSLHSRRASDADVTDVLARLERHELRSLSLRETPVSEAILERLERFAALEYLDVVGTGIGLAAVESFAARRPGLRHSPRRVG